MRRCVFLTRKPSRYFQTRISVQTKVLRYIKPVEKEHVLLGQYTANKKLDKPGYLDDDTVPKGSVCPTFAAMVLYINSPRWEGVPFVLKAGKALNEQKTEIRIQYRDVTSGIFSDIGRNELVIRVQPGEAVYLKMNTKSPGLGMKSVPTEMDLTYKRRFSDLKIPEVPFPLPFTLTAYAVRLIKDT